MTGMSKEIQTSYGGKMLKSQQSDTLMQVSSKSQDNSSLETQKEEFIKLGVPVKNIRVEVEALLLIPFKIALFSII
jgi:hypothetical protein